MKMLTNPEVYAKKKKQVAGNMNERYKNDPEYREKQKQGQKELNHKKKAMLKTVENPLE
jgi:hypothetical protein